MQILLRIGNDKIQTEEHTRYGCECIGFGRLILTTEKEKNGRYPELLVTEDRM